MLFGTRDVQLHAHVPPRLPRIPLAQYLFSKLTRLAQLNEFLFVEKTNYKLYISLDATFTPSKI
jgi:hypothetical protein